MVSKEMVAQNVDLLTLRFEKSRLRFFLKSSTSSAVYSLFWYFIGRGCVDFVDCGFTVDASAFFFGVTVHMDGARRAVAAIGENGVLDVKANMV